MAFKAKIKQAVKDWNKKNPTLRQKTISSVAEEVGVTVQYISAIGKRYKKQFNAHFEVIFNSPKKEVIKQNWESYTKLDILLLQNIEAIRTNLGCEIYDLIEKEK